MSSYQEVGRGSTSVDMGLVGPNSGAHSGNRNETDLSPPLLGLESGVTTPISTKTKWLRCGFEVFIIIIAVVIAFFVGRMSQHSNDDNTPPTPVSAKPAPVIMVSFDGMRYDYLDLAGTDRTKNFQAMKQRRDAVWARNGLRPAFPSLTFPNHYTLVSGVHPESHGITANHIYDPVLNENFEYTKHDTQGPEWWNAQTIWGAAEMFNVSTGTVFWVGSETKIQGRQPDVWLPYNGALSNADRVKQLFEWIDSDACTLCLLYFSDVDSAGHEFGAASPQALDAVANMDTMVGLIRDGLIERKLDKTASLVLLADHGMATVENFIYLDDYIDLSTPGMYRKEIGAITNIWLPLPINVALRDELVANLTKAPNMQCWARENTPPEYHYSISERIAPINCLADVGYATSARQSGSWKYPSWEKGTHGYNPKAPEMHAIFLAQSPALDSGMDGKAGVLDELANLNIYNFICHLLHISPTPNNGTLTDFAPFLTNVARKY